MTKKVKGQIKTKGFTLVETMVTIGVLSIVIVSTFNLIIYSLKLSKDKARFDDALAVANEEMEYLRSLSYNTLGTIATICQPTACSLPSSKIVNRNSVPYTVTTEIKYIDDTFDNDTSCTDDSDCPNDPYTICASNPKFCQDSSGNEDPEGPDATGLNDYKKVKISVQWSTNTGSPISIVSDFSPNDIEPNCTGGRGIIKVTVIDNNALPILGASVYINNTNIVGFAPIDVQTDAQGVVRVGCLEEDLDHNYAITINHPDGTAHPNGTVYDSTYTTDQTCPTGTGTPNPICPTLSPSNNTPFSIHPIIQNDTTAYKTFIIDKLSTLKIKTITQDLPSEWTINTATGNGKVQDMATTAVGPADSYYFFWRDDTQGPTRIYGQKYSSAKAPLWTTWESTANNNVFPNVTINQTTGDAFLTWNDNRNGNQDIYVEKLASATGVSLWTGAKKLTVTTPNQDNQDQFNPKINIENNDNFFYLTFLDNTNQLIDTNDTADIYVSRKNSADNTELYCTEDNAPCLTESAICGPTSTGTCSKWSTPELKINDDALGFVQEAVDSLVDVDDNLYAVWHDNRNGDKDIFAQKIKPDGSFDTIWSSNKQMNETNILEQSYPKIAINDEGGVKYLYVVWQDFRNGIDFDIFMNKFDTNGTKIWANDLELTSTETTNAYQTSPAITINSPDKIFVSWVDYRYGNSDIYLQKYDTSGIVQWDNDMMISNDTTTDAEQLAPQLTINSAGQVVITWEDNDAGDFDVRAATFTEPNGTIEDNVDLRIHGAKIIGTDVSSQNIYKLDKTLATNASGEINFDGLVGNQSKIEFDDYAITTGIGYNILRSDPPMTPHPTIPTISTFNISPNSANTIILTVTTAPTQSDSFSINTSGASLISSNKHLSNIILRNNGATNVVVDKIIVNWNNGKTLEEINIGTSEVWDTNVTTTGTELNVDNTTFTPSASYVLKIEFNGSMTGAIFSLTITLSDGSTKITPNFGPF